MQGKTIADRAGATLWVGWVVWWTGQAPSVRSGRQRRSSQSSQGGSELGFPRPALWQMQSEAAGRAGEPSGQGKEAPPEGLGGYHPLPQTDAHGPAGQVMGHHLDGQPCAVGGEAARGEMVEADAVLEVSDGILDLGVAAMVGLQFQGIAGPVGDEAVITVAGEEGQLGTGRVSSKAIRMRAGWLGDSIVWVLLFWDRSSVSKTIIPDSQEHPLAASGPCYTPSFGGLGLRISYPQGLAPGLPRGRRAVKSDSSPGKWAHGGPLTYTRSLL